MADTKASNKEQWQCIEFVERPRSSVPLECRTACAVALCERSAAMPPSGASRVLCGTAFQEGPSSSVGGANEDNVLEDRGGSVRLVAGMKEEVAKSVPRREPLDGELHRSRPPRPKVSSGRACRQCVAKRGGRRSALTRGRRGANVAGRSAISEGMVPASGKATRARRGRVDAGVVDKGLQPWRGLGVVVEVQRIDGSASGVVGLTRVGLKPGEESGSKPTVSRG